MSERRRQVSDVAGVAIRVRGLVQGVGFRPTVWRLARAHGLVGEVLNDGQGVLIRAWGNRHALADFEVALRDEAPPLARIHSIERSDLLTRAPSEEFRIVGSESGEVGTGVVPDAVTCPQCLADIRDPTNRRYRYPFTNCTHCGPRLSIVRAIPYDRATTSMAVFPMCGACRSEYEDPSDRRFHAQPNACPTCGPRVWLEDSGGIVRALPAGSDAIAGAAALIRAGAILAVKGIGGFHLACDACNAEAVARLRKRKQRYHKPFALMARDMEMVRVYAKVNGAELSLLESAAAPIVVLERLRSAPELAPDVAPEQSSLGFMLPYTPLHHLLLQDLETPIVLTSGNRSDEPQVVGNEEARARLATIADHWLIHDREIVNRLDDSVARVAAGSPRLVRRARGYAPAPIALAPDLASAQRVLAMGAELKATFCMLTEGQAIVSQHIGDLEDAATHADYRASLALYRDLFRFDPNLIAVDAHPNYLSTQWGAKLARDLGVPLVEVQHHHAHVASCLAEHQVPLAARPVLGIVLDGLGLGEEGALWGGEFLLASYTHSQRLAAFAPVPLVGGAKAMREPWRNAFAHISQFVGLDAFFARYPDLPITRLITEKPVATLETMMARGLNAPPASSAGRLFDAVAAVLGISPEATSFEGQAAVGLETLAALATGAASDAYRAEIIDGAPLTLSWGPLWHAILEDLSHGVDRANIAARFHAGLAEAIGALVQRLRVQHPIDTVVLGGGVFQNRLILESMTHVVRRQGLQVLSPRLAPANDGGLSLGQAAIAEARNHCDLATCQARCPTGV